MTEIMKLSADAISFKDKTLTKYTNQIFREGFNIKKATMKIAVILARIDDAKCYEKDGFKSVNDYAQTILGVKYAQTSAIIKVGKTLVDEKSYESVLYHEEQDYGMTQLQALLPLKSATKAQELAENGTINPYMTVKEIKEVVKAIKGNNEPVKSNNDNDDTENDVSNVVVQEGPTIEHTIQIGTYKDGIKYVCIDDVIYDCSADTDKLYDALIEYC